MISKFNSLLQNSHSYKEKNDLKQYFTTQCHVVKILLKKIIDTNDNENSKLKKK